MDVLSVEQRSALMRRVRQHGTKPELVVRRFLHASGLRYRLNVRSLPGSPDLVFPKYKAVVLVHGCYWHRHAGCRFTTLPSSNVDFWQQKFAANVERDRRKERELRALGWRVFVVWGCETSANRLQRLAREIKNAG